MKNKKLTELMAANKVDDSVISVIKENEKAYDNTKRKIRKLNSDIEEINGKIESVKPVGAGQMHCAVRLHAQRQSGRPSRINIFLF